MQAEQKKKSITVLIPCYNEEGNIGVIFEKLQSIFDHDLTAYDCSILFIDNHSDDGSRDIIRRLCEQHSHVRAIINIRNYGAFDSPFYGMLEADSDCVIVMACDMQEPPELIPEFVQKWEAGANVVAGVQSGSKENKLVYGLRSLFYRMMNRGSSMEHIQHFTGFGLYDRSFLEILEEIDDPLPFLRGMVAEFGSRVEKVYYEQPRRYSGKSHNSFFDLYDATMRSFTSYTSMGLRLVTIMGFTVSVISLLIGLVYFILKIIHWNTFNAGMAPVLIGMFFLGAVLLMTVGLIGEYIISINRRIMHRPLVIEEERIGFERD